MRPSDGDTSDQHRMVRRGITYAPGFSVGKPAYGQTVPDTQDRGLLLLNCQSSIARIFEFVRAQWANRDDFQATARTPSSARTREGTFNLPAHGQVAFAVG